MIHGSLTVCCCVATPLPQAGGDGDASATGWFADDGQLVRLADPVLEEGTRAVGFGADASRQLTEFCLPTKADGRLQAAPFAGGDGSHPRDAGEYELVIQLDALQFSSHPYSTEEHRLADEVRARARVPAVAARRRAFASLTLRAAAAPPPVHGRVSAAHGGQGGAPVAAPADAARGRAPAG